MVKNNKNKIVKTLEKPLDIMDSPISWNFSYMDFGGKWPCDFIKLHKYYKNIVSFEGIKVKDIFNFQRKDRHTHPISINRLNPIAQTRLNDLNLNYDIIYQLRLTQKVRLWGILEYNIFYILWLDENHEVCS